MERAGRNFRSKMETNWNVLLIFDANLQMMMKKWFVILLLACMMPGVKAQQAKDCFLSMPDSLLPLLSAVNRADFVDFLASGMKAEVTNRFDGKSEMKQLTDDFIEIQMTPQSLWQLKLLPAGEKKVLCVVSTACGPVCDSSVRFYDTGWQELPASDFIGPLPAMDDFFLPVPDSINRNRYDFYRSQADVLFMQVTLSAADASLVFTCNTLDVLDPETVRFLEPLSRKQLVSRWQNGKFVY